MAGPHKTLEEQLEEARLKKQKANTRLQQLEAKRKARDSRMRLKAEKQLLKIVIERTGAQPLFKNELRRAVAAAAIPLEERAAILTLFDDDGKSPSPAPGIFSSLTSPAENPPRPSGAALGSSGDSGPAVPGLG